MFWPGLIGSWPASTTDRINRASKSRNAWSNTLKNPNVSAGSRHPTGRILNRRKSYEVDLDAVFKVASDYGKLLELNANPARLDTGRRCLRRGRAARFRS